MAGCSARAELSEESGKEKPLDFDRAVFFSVPSSAIETNYCLLRDCIPNRHRMELLAKLAEDYHADAIVEIVLQACHTYAVEAAGVCSLADELKIPYLKIEADYSTSDLEQLRTRMEALLEML